MICSNCANQYICKYKDNTESFERNFNLESESIIPSNLDNLVARIDCKYYTSSEIVESYTTTYCDSTSPTDASKKYYY